MPVEGEPLDKEECNQSCYRYIGGEKCVVVSFVENNLKNFAGAIGGSRTLQLLDFAGCDATTSHLATSMNRTLRCWRVIPCTIRLLHSATQKAYCLAGKYW